jgi:hypothetical protein
MTFAGLKQKSTYVRLGQELRYSLYCIFHPADGFWCINREKKASVASAHILLFLCALVNVLRLTLTNFQFVLINIEYYNAITSALSIIMPLVLWSVANWGFTTLMNGKGRLSDIYVASVYAFTPSLILNAVCIPLSHVITYNEGVLYRVSLTIAMIWSIMLLLVAMMQVHDYTMLKAIASGFLTIAGIGFILFIFMLFFSLISDSVVFFIGLVNEIIFRLY